MGDWRHFDEPSELTLALQDCAASGDGDRHRAYAASDLPRRPARDRSRSAIAYEELSRVVEAEILPRLMLAHRTAARAPTAAARHPTPAQIARFSSLLLSNDADATSDVIALLGDGLALDALLLDLLAPAARHLGELWEADECDFVDVTVALGRLQSIARELCTRFETGSIPQPGRSILLMPCPGETHLFGLSLAASFFREAGWDVSLGANRTMGELVDLVRTEWFEVVGLSLSCEVHIPAMADAVRTLRYASRNRGVRILVGGPYFTRLPGDGHRVGADAAAADGRSAPAIAEGLLELRA